MKSRYRYVCDKGKDRIFLRLFKSLLLSPNSGQYWRWASYCPIFRNKPKTVSDIFTTNPLRISITIFPENIALNGRKKIIGKMVEIVKQQQKKIETMRKIKSKKTFSSLFLQCPEKGRSPMIFHMLLHNINAYYRIILSLGMVNMILCLWKGS